MVVLEICEMAKIVMISVSVVSKWDRRRLAVWYLSFFLLGAGWVARSVR